MQPQQQPQQFVNIGGPYNMGYTVVPPTDWTPSMQPARVDAFKHRQAIALGATLIVAGALSVIFNIVDLGLLASLYFTFGFIGHGIWTGVMAIIAGGLGIGAGKSKQRCMICAFNVLCIITASLTVGEFIAGVIGAAVMSGRNSCEDRYGYGGPSTNSACASVAMEALMAIMAVVTAGAAIWGSVLCCNAACCCYNGPTMPYVVQYSGTQMPMTVINTAQGQQLVPIQFAAYPYQMPQQVGQPQLIAAPPQYAPPAVPAFQPPAYTSAPAMTPVAGAVGGMDHLQQQVDQKNVV